MAELRYFALNLARVFHKGAGLGRRAHLRQIAAAGGRMGDPPLPGLRHTFDQPADDGTVRAIVRAETWWWAEESPDRRRRQ